MNDPDSTPELTSDPVSEAPLLEERHTLRLRGLADGGVLTVELHRPQVLNAMSGAMRDELAAVLGDVAEGPWGAVVLCGAGRAFSAGADLGAYLDEVDIEDPAAVRAYVEAWNRVILGLRGAAVPTVAAVHGAAYGGGANLALACDLVVVGDSARLCQPYIDIGATADLGASWLLPRLVGLATARRLVMLGEVVDAGAALALGLATERVPDPQLRSRAVALAERLAAKDPAVLRANRELLDHGAGVELPAALEAEVAANVALLGASGFRDVTRRYARTDEPDTGGGR